MLRQRDRLTDVEMRPDGPKIVGAGTGDGGEQVSMDATYRGVGLQLAASG